MTTPQLFPAQGRIARAWRNGGGVTRDVAVHPPGAADGDFLWRASIATIAEPGVFSLWPGVDRVFKVLRGQVRLSIGGAPAQLLGGDDPAIAFAGEAEVWGDPVGGECTVLNIMTMRGRGQSRITNQPGRTGDGERQILLLARRRVAFDVGDHRIALQPDDALLISAHDLPELGAGDAIYVELAFPA